ncbi:MAG: type II secretion system F family protein [Kiritimatiellae bacterium]|nr:type II secretion system F family protein [Kiritimatiellia bacterium]
MDDLFLYLILFIAVLLVVWQALAYLRKFKQRAAIPTAVKLKHGDKPINAFITDEALSRLRVGLCIGGGVVGLLFSLLVAMPGFMVVLLSLGGALGGWFGPLRYYQRKVEERRASFERQMLNIVMGFASNLKAGMGISQALRTLAEHMPGVGGEELMLMLEELPLCKDINEAFDLMYERVPCEDLLLTKSAVRLSLKSGGGLTEIMAQLSETIRERNDFRERLANRVEQGKFEAKLMACAPIGIFLILLLIDTELMLPLVTTPMGWTAITIVAVLETLGFLWIRKIVTIEV